MILICAIFSEAFNRFKMSKDSVEKPNVRWDENNAVAVERPHVRWEDIAGLEDAKLVLKAAVTLPINSPQIFNANRAPWRGILLSGPPGTGKSYLAKAVATEAHNTTFITVVRSAFVSKKSVRALFKFAKSNKPSVIFFDEVDSLCCSDDEAALTRQIKAEFLVQMQGNGHDMEGICLLGATNNLDILDAATLQLFEKRISIPLPNKRARQVMFVQHIGDAAHNLSVQQMQELVRKTEGYSGHNIRMIMRDALMQPVRKVQVATHFKTVSGPSQHDPQISVSDLLMPCTSDDPDAQPMTWRDVPSDKLSIGNPVLSLADIDKSINDFCKNLPKLEEQQTGWQEGWR